MGGPETSKLTVDKKQANIDKQEGHAPLKLEERLKSSKVQIPLMIEEKDPAFEQYMDEQLNNAYDILEGKKAESKEGKAKLLSLQKVILSNEHMTDRHKDWLQRKTDELVKNKDKKGLEQINKGIDFADGGRLVLHTKLGDLKFASHQATFDDVKNIKGVKENENIWTKNKATGKEGLRANFDAIEKIQGAGKKKICTSEQFIAAANVFPGGDELTDENRSTKMRDFLTLLGLEESGYRGMNGDWFDSYSQSHQSLWSGSEAFLGSAYSVGFDATQGSLYRRNKNYGFNVWLLEY